MDFTIQVTSVHLHLNITKRSATLFHHDLKNFDFFNEAISTGRQNDRINMTWKHNLVIKKVAPIWSDWWILSQIWLRYATYMCSSSIASNSIKEITIETRQLFTFTGDKKWDMTQSQKANGSEWLLTAIRDEIMRYSGREMVNLLAHITITVIKWNSKWKSFAWKTRRLLFESQSCGHYHRSVLLSEVACQLSRLKLL